MNKVDDILAHYGVPGMKWGVRRSRKQLARASKESSDGGTKGGSKKEPSAKKTKTNKSPKGLSDAELKAAVNRLQMEKQYKELTKGPPTARERGKKAVAGIMGSVAKASIQAVGQSYANQALKPYMAGGSKALGNSGKKIPPPPKFVSPLPRPKAGTRKD